MTKTPNHPSRGRRVGNPTAQREFTVLIEQDEDAYFVAEVPELRGCYTQAKTMDELVARAKEVILLCLDEQAPPSPRLRFIGLQRVSV